MRRGAPPRRGPPLGPLALALLLALPWSALGGAIGLPPRPAAAPATGGGPAGNAGGPSPRDPAVIPSGFGEILVGTSDPNAVPNEGILTNLSGYAVSPFPADMSFQMGAEEALGVYYAAFGLFQNSGSGPYPFFSVFNNSSGAPIYQVNMSFNPVSPGGAYDFALVHTTGTNWTLDLNGVAFDGSPRVATFDFGVTACTYLPLLSFSLRALATQTVVPPAVTVPTTFGVLRPGGWYLPSTGLPSVRGTPDWGIAGDEQDGELYPGEISFGTGVAPVANATPLWNGSAVPVELGLTADPASTPGTGTSLLTATSTTFGGSAMGGFPLALSDQLGGNFTSQDPVSNSAGTAQVGYIAPNVSANTTDRLVLASRILGASGTASTLLTLTPAVQVLLVGAPPGPLAPSSTERFELVAEGTSGTPLPGVVLDLYVTGEASVAPGQAVTDLQGELPVVLTAGSHTGPFTLSIIVATAGYWGHRSLTLQIQPLAPSPLARLLAYWPAVAIVLAAAVVLLYVRRRRARARQLPPMDLRRLAARPPPPGGAADDASSAPFSRTPP